MMASEFAKKLAPKLPAPKFIGGTALLDRQPLEQAIDTALAPVRECLEAMATQPGEPGDFCWCYTDTGKRTMAMAVRGEHLPNCQRAQDLWQQLKIEE